MSGTEVVLKKTIDACPEHAAQMRQLLANLALMRVANVGSDGVHRMPESAPEDALLLTTCQKKIPNFISSLVMRKFHNRQLEVIDHVMRGFGALMSEATLNQPERKMKILSGKNSGAVGTERIYIQGISERDVILHMRPVTQLDLALMDDVDFPAEYVLSHELQHVEQYLRNPVMSMAGGDSRQLSPNADIKRYRLNMELEAYGVEHAIYNASGERLFADNTAALMERTVKKILRNPSSIRPLTADDNIFSQMSHGNPQNSPQ